MPNPKGGLLCTILGMIMAVSVNTANGATGYACYPSTSTSPTSCDNHIYTQSTGGWAVFGCTGSNVRFFFGASGCSDSFGTLGYVGNPTFSDSGGQYCWCKMYGTDLNYVPGSWVSGRDDHYASSASDCANDCASLCGYYAMYNSTFRSVLFSS
ncbi:MAG: hypothetical protein LBD50_00990 [Rickettsiales bacterium]|jgi:hypothetical protein|nr:hypothetical protein [Rickettsiales bacterium]